MSSNVGIKPNPIKLTIPDYATKNGVSTSTVRNQIRTGKVEWEKEKGKYLIHDYQVGTKPDKVDINIDINDLLSEKDILIQSLQEQIEIKDK